MAKALGKHLCTPQPAGYGQSSWAWRPWLQHNRFATNSSSGSAVSLCFPQTPHYHTRRKSKAASISTAGTSNESNSVDTDCFSPETPPCPGSSPAGTIYHIPSTSTHQARPSGNPSNKPGRGSHWKHSQFPHSTEDKNQEKTWLFKSTYLPEEPKLQQTKARSELSAPGRAGGWTGQRRLLQPVGHSCAAGLSGTVAAAGAACTSLCPALPCPRHSSSWGLGLLGELQDVAWNLLPKVGFFCNVALSHLCIYQPVFFMITCGNWGMLVSKILHKAVRWQGILQPILFLFPKQC